MQVPRIRVWMRLASRDLTAVLSVWALLTPNRVFPAKFSMKAKCARTEVLAALLRATAGATPRAHRPSKEAAVLVASSVGQSLSTMEWT